MNPKNVKDFFDKYDEGIPSAIIKRFFLNDYTVVESMYKYLNYIIENWLGLKEISGTYEHNAMA